MSIEQWLAFTAGALFLGFVVFAFRQGMKVPPSGNRIESGENYSGGSQPHHHGD